jgi:hypothetical protein
VIGSRSEGYQCARASAARRARGAAR